MPDLKISDALYRQLENRAGDGDVESAVWELLYHGERDRTFDGSDDPDRRAAR
jgi:hypothetical protein